MSSGSRITPGPPAKRERVTLSNPAARPIASNSGAV